VTSEINSTSAIIGRPQQVGQSDNTGTAVQLQQQPRDVNRHSIAQRPPSDIYGQRTTAIYAQRCTEYRFQKNAVTVLETVLVGVPTQNLNS